MQISVTLVSFVAVAVNLATPAVASPVASSSAPATTHIPPPATGDTSVVLGQSLGPDRPAEADRGTPADIVITAATLDPASNKTPATRSFQNSCEDCRIENGVDLRCLCWGNQVGLFNWSYLWLGGCLENSDGNLNWKRNGWYTRSCDLGSGRWDNGMFRIYCDTADGRPHSTSIDLGARIHNYNMVLGCDV